MKFIISLACLSSLIFSVGRADAGAVSASVPSSVPTSTSAAPSTTLGYPELQVSPRASERIVMESRSEAKNRKTQLLPLQISALSTLLAGALAPKPSDPDKRDRDDVKYSHQVAMGVGLSWLVFSYFFNEEYAPYSKAVASLKSSPDKNQREELVRERMAEESMEAASSLGKKMMWASVATNLAASAYLASNTSNEGTVYAAAAAVLSLAPVVFRDRWQIVNDYHQDYKKRIYGPIALPTVLVTPLASHRTSTAVPGVSWQLSF